MYIFILLADGCILVVGSLVTPIPNQAALLDSEPSVRQSVLVGEARGTGYA
ncbi:hypothetical protein IE4803_CH02483 [Rhizobium etli bv. phaseoli str. IE4803]|uniref:Uncharacterized protein n=1 Tax=Rhizobium etli bv. mimosae str. IE4771 TaxID=1432050 RepID=A0A060HXM6_RHIET|nr:hypothetical protein IE4771_CH02568 [Rhizobium sp. IE4771]AJC79672.1 hypothetical protein IE4803_CH02483 [Rhizobium etli bv. phaseoli str. IE4803]